MLRPVIVRALLRAELAQLLEDPDLPDECGPDCNANGVPDVCDIADGFSTEEEKVRGKGVRKIFNRSRKSS